jgi:hypothetical protein
MFYGEEPPTEIDHIDRNKDNNSIRNLRAAIRKQNAANRPSFKSNTSGCIGVCWAKNQKKWFAYVWMHGKSVHLGSFANYDDAVAARKAAADKAYGEFSPHIVPGVPSAAILSSSSVSVTIGFAPQLT